MIREGYIEKIVYKSDETGYCVMSVEGEEGEEIFVGSRRYLSLASDTILASCSIVSTWSRVPVKVSM